MCRRVVKISSVAAEASEGNEILFAAMSFEVLRMTFITWTSSTTRDE